MGASSPSSSQTYGGALLRVPPSSRGRHAAPQQLLSASWAAVAAAHEKTDTFFCVPSATNGCATAHAAEKARGALTTKIEPTVSG